MLLKRQHRDGTLLSDEELVELVNMYQSGKYFVTEIRDWFGLNDYEFRAYMKLAKEKNLC